MQSNSDPLQPTLSTLDRFEYWLLTLDHDTFDKISKPHVEIRDDAPSLTGDPIGDQWEREFWEKQRGK